MSKFTPGPWKRYERTDGGFVVTTQAGLSPVSLANVIVRRDLHEFKANADLIAAAPELYAALDALLNHSHLADLANEDLDPDDINAESNARAALRKARGESS